MGGSCSRIPSSVPGGAAHCQGCRQEGPGCAGRAGSEGAGTAGFTSGEGTAGSTKEWFQVGNARARGGSGDHDARTFDRQRGTGTFIPGWLEGGWRGQGRGLSLSRLPAILRPIPRGRRDLATDEGLEDIRPRAYSSLEALLTMSWAPILLGPWCPVAVSLYRCPQVDAGEWR